jgi:hypothetical protein
MEKYIMTSAGLKSCRYGAFARVLGATSPAWLLIGGLAFLSPGSADAQQAGPQALQCAAHQKMVERLSAKFTEAPVSLGLSASGHVFQVFTTKGGDTWTIVATAPEGQSCIMASGKYWQDISFEPQGPEA